MNCQTCAHYTNATLSKSASSDHGFCNAAPSFRNPVLPDGKRAPIDNTHMIHGGDGCHFAPSRFKEITHG